MKKWSLVFVIAPLLMGAKMCESAKVEETKEEAAAVEEAHNPMKKIPRDYKKAIEVRTKNFDSSVEKSLGEEGESKDLPKGWKGQKKWKGPK